MKDAQLATPKQLPEHIKMVNQPYMQNTSVTRQCVRKRSRGPANIAQMLRFPPFPMRFHIENMRALATMLAQ